MNREWIKEFDNEENPINDPDITRKEKFKLGYYSSSFVMRGISDKFKLKTKQLGFLEQIVKNHKPVTLSNEPDDSKSQTEEEQVESMNRMIEKKVIIKVNIPC